MVLSQELKEILIGLILGDAHLEKQSLTANARLRFSQGLIHKEYIEHIFLLFKPYCASDKPREYNYLDKRFQKVYFSLHFQTRALLCFTEVYNLFYKKGNKIVPENHMELLTATGLAYLAQDDGAKHGKGFVLNTQSFTKADNLFLIKVLKTKFNLDCSLHTRKATTGTIEYFTIFIKQNSMDKFRELVKPHFHTSMLYKLD